MRLRRLVIAFFVSMALSAAISLGLRAGGPRAKTNPTPTAENTSGLFLPPPPAFLAGASAKTASSSSAGLTVKEIDRRQILEALKRTARLLDGPEKAETRRRLIAQFVALDPHMALTYVDTLAGDEHARQKINAMSAWAARDAAAASAFFDENDLRGGFTEDADHLAAAAIAKEWVVQDPKAAFAWVSSLPEEARTEAVSAMVARLAKHDPQIALQMVDALDANYERAEAMQPLAEQWGQSAPVVAAAWVSGLRNEPERNYAASGLITGWMDADARAATQWVTQLPIGSTRDAAIAAMVQTTAAHSIPQTIAPLAASIQDAQLRGQILPQIRQQWQAIDPAAAARWFSSQP